MKVAQVSDIHFGAEDHVALKEAEAVIEREAPDALLVCGDVTQRGKRIEFDAARRWIDQFALPKLVVAGNHDTPLLNITKRVTAPFERFERHFRDLMKPLDLSGLRFVGLNTARGWQARRNWAEGSVNLKTLESIIDHSNRTVLVCHHPLVSPPHTPLRTRTRRGRAADRMLKPSNVQLLLCGHVHSPTCELREGASEEDGYVSVTSGTLSRRLRRAPPSLNLIDIRNDAVSIDVFPVDGSGDPPERIGHFPVPVTSGSVRITG